MFNLNLEIMAITEKIYESFAMFMSMDNKEGRKLVYRIAMNSMNLNEKITFYKIVNNYLMKGVNMRTLDLKKIEKNCKAANKASKIAMVTSVKVFVSQISLRITTMFIGLLICFFINAQEFKTIDKRGMTKQQIADTCAVVAWCRVSNIFEGEQCDIYTGLDFASVMFIFNKAGNCYKIRFKNSVKSPIIFDKSVKWSSKSDKYMTEYVVE
jgi:hypothetical protein